ncbi:hypothetical protein MN608_11586 [Microdochium nivale]|nr:hypothetical protein MN608_11586 [Microdochium nivale]
MDANVDTSTLTGALGSVIGYLGSEVAEPQLFERLLWPQRFYNDLTPSVALKHALLMTMGGPLHSAALKVLDIFGKHGLYLGRGRGNMLGTVFFPDSGRNFEGVTRGVGAVEAGHEERDLRTGACRNAFWIEVLLHVNRAALRREVDVPDRVVISKGEDGAAKTTLTATVRSSTVESGTIERSGPSPKFRAIQAVHHLSLRAVLDSTADAAESVENVYSMTEDGITFRTLLAVVLSELVAIAAAIASVFLGSWWMTIVLMIPCILKLLITFLAAEREGLRSAAMHGHEDQDILYKIEGSQQGFLLIQGPKWVVDQFFLHYGHPLRNQQHLVGSHFRQLACMSVTYCFVVLFPLGLILTICMTEPAQYLWLAYQLYAVVAMHIARLCNWEGCGRTEERVARYLSQGHAVRLCSAGGTTVEAVVRTDIVASYAEGQSLVRDRITQHFTGGAREQDVQADSFQK